MPDPMTLFLTALGTTAGRSATAEAAKVLREVAGLQEAQTSMLRALDAKVDALVEGPFNTGQRQLRDAIVAGRGMRDREHLLREARASFTAALGQDHDPLRRSFAALALSAVWLALGSPDDAQRSLAEAHRDALRATTAEMAVQTKPTPVELALELRRASTRVRRKRARQTLAPYANEIATTRRAWGSSAAAAPQIVGLSRAEDYVESMVRSLRRSNKDPTRHGAARRPAHLHAEIVAIDGQFRRGEKLDVDLLPKWLRDGGDRAVV